MQGELINKKHHSASIYSKNVLMIYDLLVLGISNKYAWKCSTKFLLNFYNEHISAKHLDVGVGTGYYLSKCKFPTPSPTLHLLDLNLNSLATTAKRIRKYNPICHQADILKPLTLKLPKFHSIGINYLFHCLPGDMKKKEKVFNHLIPFLHKDGVIFGSTILGEDVKANPLARKIINFYNKKGIFSNKADNIDALEALLRKKFTKYTIKQVGCVALFSGSV